jgi:membrane protein involved in colicin uptake
MADARSATWAAARAGWDAAMAATWAAARAGWDAAWDAQLDDLVARLDRSLTTTTKKGESHV